MATDAQRQALIQQGRKQGRKQSFSTLGKVASMSFLIMISFFNCVAAASSYSYVSNLRGCRICDCADDSDTESKKLVLEMMRLTQANVGISLVLFLLVLLFIYSNNLTAIKFLTALALLCAIGLIGVDVQLHIKNNKPSIKILKEKLGLTLSKESQMNWIIVYRLVTILFLIPYFIWTYRVEIQDKLGKKQGNSGKTGTPTSTPTGTTT